ncbi:MAG: B12-binding domain-containing radical SAM protein, partial [Filifactoraceae bacterium]
MKVLLGTLNAKFVHTNLALRYLEEAIKSETIVDRKEFTINEDQDGILYRILHGGYDIVAFSCYIWNINKILELASNIKKVEPRIKIILGGPEVSYESKELMEKNEFIDYIISGEGEESLRELIKALKFNGSYTEVSGLRYRKEEKIILNEINVLEDLSESVAAYRSVEYKEIENKIVYYETSRGCGYNCAYCLSSLDKSIRAYPM